MHSTIAAVPIDLTRSKMSLLAVRDVRWNAATHDM